MKSFYIVLKLPGRSRLITRKIRPEPGLEPEPKMRDLKDLKPDRLDCTGAGSGPSPGSVPVRAGSSGSIAHTYKDVAEAKPGEPSKKKSFMQKPSFFHPRLKITFLPSIRTLFQKKNTSNLYGTD